MNKTVLAIDIGATSSKFAIVDSEGSILGRRRVATVGHSSPEAFVDAIYEAARELASTLTDAAPISAVGAGAPCANGNSGCVEGAVTMPWSDFPLAALLEERFRVPAAITNDANAAAAGEHLFGVAKGMDNFIMLTLGTGVGGGVFVDGRLLNGARGFAAELGHISAVDHSDRVCDCGNRGCLQTYASASGVVATARQFLEFSKGKSLLREIPVNELTSQKVYEAAMQGDMLARDVFSFTGEILGKACAGYVAFADPEAIVLFGGVARAGDLLRIPMQRALEAYSLSIFKGKVKVLFSTLPGDDAAILGAAALVI